MRTGAVPRSTAPWQRRQRIGSSSVDGRRVWPSGIVSSRSTWGGTTPMGPEWTGDGPIGSRERASAAFSIEFPRKTPRNLLQFSCLGVGMRAPSARIHQDRRAAFAVTLLLAAPAAFAEAPAVGFARGQIIDGVTCAAAHEESYALYLPSGYTPERAWPILYILDPRSRGALAAEKFRAGAEKH